MAYLLVNLTDDECQAGDLVEILDAKLHKALKAPEKLIALELRAETKGVGDLLEWLENVTRIFTKARKELVVVPGSPEILEYLKLSHPDQALRYVESLELLEQLAAQMPAETVAAKAPVKPIDAAPKTDASVVEPSHLPEREPTLVAPAAPVDNTPPALARPGFLADVSGEFQCLGCGATRMWLKGDLVLTCVNPECLKPEVGWRLLFDVF
jgi:hypothetical protein